MVHRDSKVVRGSLSYLDRCLLTFVEVLHRKEACDERDDDLLGFDSVRRVRGMLTTEGGYGVSMGRIEGGVSS